MCVGDEQLHRTGGTRRDVQVEVPRLLASGTLGIGAGKRYMAVKRLEVNVYQDAEGTGTVFHHR